MPEIFSIGLYQLENLIFARPSFRFIDLRMRPQTVTAVRVQSLISHSVPVRQSDLRMYLQNLDVRKDEPIVLFCEDGRLSSTAALELEAAGYSQVYVVEGGLDGLLRDATLSG